MEKKEDISNIPKSNNKNLNEKIIPINIAQNEENEKNTIQENNFENGSPIIEQKKNIKSSYINPNNQDQIEQNIISSSQYENVKQLTDKDIIENQKELNVSDIKNLEKSNNFLSKEKKTYGITEDYEERNII
jgi:hypothetical protein